MWHCACLRVRGEGRLGACAADAFVVGKVAAVYGLLRSHASAARAMVGLMLRERLPERKNN